MDARPTYLRTRLSVMMFLQFFIWGAWWVPVSTYAMEGLRFTPDDMTWIVSTIALGAMVSPLFGLIADRFLPTQWVLGGLHVIGGLCLILAGFQETFGWMFVVLLVNTICFMPTLALANSLSFRNLDDPNKFPRIALFGTIGWIVAGNAVGWLLGETKPYFFFLAGVVGLIQGAYCCFALPHTPPKRGVEAGADVFGLGALKLLKERSFLIFAVCAFLVVIPINYYFAGCNPMLAQHEWPAPTAVMTLGQVTEVFVMFSMAGLIAALGLRNILALGMLVWALRYLLFATGAFPLVLLGIIIHGFGYCFVYVGAYIYVDKWAPRHMRASAQSLIAFLMLGVGMLVGTKAAGWTLAEFPAVVSSIEATKVTEKASETDTNAPIPAWKDLSELDTNHDGEIGRAEVRAVGDAGLTVGEGFPKFIYSNKEIGRVLLAADNLKTVRTRGDFRSAVHDELTVSRPDWIRAKLRHWAPFWLWPALASAVVGILYWFASLATPEPPEEAREPGPAEKPRAEPPAEPPPLTGTAQAPGEAPSAPQNW